MSVKFANNVMGGVSKSDTGTTTNDYVNAVALECLGYNNKNILIANTGSNSMMYSVSLYIYPDSVIPYEFITDASVLAGLSDIIELSRSYAKAVVSVKSAVPGSHTTYQIDFSGC